MFGKFISVNVERIFSDPDIYVFRSIASDDWMYRLRRFASFNLQPSMVINLHTGELEVSHLRVAEAAWYGLENDPFYKRIRAKLTIATGLSLTTVEKLQLANYGLGGYYTFHYDFLTKEMAKNDQFTVEKGNRLATFMLYMSDIPLGGRTGFSRLGISLKPSKGDALFWYNLFPDESGDPRTHVLSCPVALGSSWAGSIWIRSNGEEFTRPCSLEQQNGI
ncbi:Prolyl 4-hydroxylase subunit alpha-2 [Thelohanellus kitauei]|uniref:Prolyl 4-hydroxylase subunit alpha-2 n=1 Tax=Thelohanellus kitauei TaxID=669202 RepID=A0A0C2IN25_THEKT|nr:Prolyl 4-hydroxylase subunit alpha-2 [Thelohanellus kitauei]